MLKYILFYLFGGMLLCFSGFLSAQEVENSQLFEFVSENDVYLMNGQDRYYTNGVLFHYRKRMKNDHSKTVATSMVFSLGHKIFNGVDINVKNQLEYDRPFSGYLFLNAGIQRTFPKSLINGSIEFGQVGPAAEGQQAQEAFHSLFGFYKVKGWKDWQLSNAFGVDVQATYVRNLMQSTYFQWDVQGTGRMGMNFSNLQLSAPIRIGHVQSISRSLFYREHIGQNLKEKEWYFFYSYALRRQFYDVTYQGGMFKNDPIGDLYALKPWVGIHHFGFNWTNQHIAAGLNYIVQSKEAVQNFYRHQYGQLFFAIQF